MVEFGEKLKKAREGKGMTQQTLADHLYVTRQAVSRWECGARYPDLLTAKKLSDVLEVTLDELLSGEELKQCVEKNPIVESPVIGRVQSALYAFAGAAYLLMSILSLRFLPPALADVNLQTMGYGISYILRYVLITILLFVGLIFSVCGKLTPKKTGVIVAAYFGMELFSNIFEPMQTGTMWPTTFQSLIDLSCIAVIVGYYFQKRRRSPIPMYCVAAFGLIKNIFMYFRMIQLESDVSLIVRNIWLAAVAGYMVLIAYQTYALEKKWRLAVKQSM
jgi:transcriptional regulator with XRE-family HTH domain